MSRTALVSVVMASVAGLALVASTAQRAPTGRAQPRNPQPAPTGQTATFVQSAYMDYVGAFRLPGQSGPGGETGDLNSFNGGGEALAYHAANRTLFLTGSRCCHPTTVAEITIPELRRATSIAELATASYRQPHAALLGTRQADVGCGGPLGGLLPWGSTLIASVYCYYDAAYIQNRSHYRTSLNLAQGEVLGPVEIATGVSSGGRAGFVSGYMAAVPPEWQAALGGPAVTGNCCIPIITRTSWGPGLSVFDPADIGIKNPVPATTLVRYTAENPTLGACDSDGDVPANVFNCTTSIVGVVIPRGTSSVLFFGSHGTGKHCYGENTPDPARHGTANPKVPGEVVCYDPGRSGKGPHAYPYVHMVWAYSLTDLVAVKNRQRQPWQIRPYSTWTFDTPFSIPSRVVTGVAYDEAEQRIFVSMGEQDQPRPLIHVFNLRLTPGAASGQSGA